MEDFLKRMELVKNTSRSERKLAREAAGKRANNGIPLSRDVFYSMTKKKSEAELSHPQRMLFLELEKLVYQKLNLEKEVSKLKENVAD